MAVEKIIEEVRSLSREDQEHLMAELLRIFESESRGGIVEADAEVAWAAELDRRLRAFEEGRVQSVPLDQAMAQVRARLARP